MRALAKAFREMIDYLNRHGMAHGDLSGDNIMVTPQRQLVLIDYDSFSVKGQPANIQQPTAGIKAFQHPQRGANRYLNTYMDFFSQQVIYLSLLAIAEKPDLFDVDTDKGLLFQDADLRNEAALIQSTAYKGISTIANTEVKARLADLRKDIAVQFDKVRSLTAIYEWEAELERRRKEGRSKPKTDIQVPPRKDKEPVREVKTLAPFCGICGYQFPTSGDNANYCPMCGTQRRTLEQNQLPPWRTDNSPYQGGTKKR
jgi:serine/threonine protein kinase